RPGVEADGSRSRPPGRGSAGRADDQAPARGVRGARAIDLGRAAAPVGDRHGLRGGARRAGAGRLRDPRRLAEGDAAGGLAASAADGPFSLDRNYLATGPEDRRPAFLAPLGPLRSRRPAVRRSAGTGRAGRIPTAGGYPLAGPDRPVSPGPVRPPLRLPGPAGPPPRADRPPAPREGRHRAPGRPADLALHQPGDHRRVPRAPPEHRPPFSRMDVPLDTGAGDGDLVRDRGREETPAGGGP